MPNKYYEEIFRQNGASYHRAMELYPTARDEEFRTALTFLKLKDGDTLLDVPAGGGYLEAYLPEGIDYLGYDFSGSFGHTTKSVLKCSETSVGLPNSSVDHVVCLAALHHVEDRLGFYREAWRLLKPGGMLLIGDVLLNSPQDSFLNEFVNQWNKLGHQGDFIQPDREKAELKSVGFCCELDVRDYHWNFASLEDARNYFRLLFTMNKHPGERDLDCSIDQLGVKKTSSHFRVSWRLGFIRAIKAS